VVAGLSPEVGHEPVLALDGGEDGLRFYRRLLALSPLLREGGFLLLEGGYDQAADLARLAAACRLEMTPYYDYGKNFRGGLFRPL
jgi:methylase of polypeptide subunit release factors